MIRVRHYKVKKNFLDDLHYTKCEENDNKNIDKDLADFKFPHFFFLHYACAENVLP